MFSVGFQTAVSSLQVNNCSAPFYRLLVRTPDSSLREYKHRKPSAFTTIFLQLLCAAILSLFEDPGKPTRSDMTLYKNRHTKRIEFDQMELIGNGSTEREWLIH